MITIKKNGEKVWVTFTFAPAKRVDDVVVSGEWNEWQEERMKQKKSGVYSITKVLKAGERFQFGYKVNGNSWITEQECQSVPSPFSSENSLLEL